MNAVLKNNREQTHFSVARIDVCDEEKNGDGRGSNKAIPNQIETILSQTAHLII